MELLKVVNQLKFRARMGWINYTTRTRRLFAMISRRSHISANRHSITYSERRSAPVSLLIQIPRVCGLLLHTNVAALGCLNRSGQFVSKQTAEIDFSCDSWLLSLNVIEPPRSYAERCNFSSVIYGKVVRFEDDQGDSKAAATFDGNGLRASCPIIESIQYLLD